MNDLIGKLKTDFAELDKRFNKKNRDVGLLAIEKTKAVERITNLLVIKQTDVLKLQVVH